MQAKNTIDEKLESIKTAILKYVPAKYIYLFGSYANGTQKDGSDIDIYAVIPDEDDNNAFLWSNIYGEMREMSIEDDIDLIIRSESKFNYRKENSRFESTICETGRLLYANT